MTDGFAIMLRGLTPDEQELLKRRIAEVDRAMKKIAEDLVFGDQESDALRDIADA